MRLAAVLMTVILLATGCSTTKRLADGELLYNGMKLELHPSRGEKLPAGDGFRPDQGGECQAQQPLASVEPVCKESFPGRIVGV